jgi:hypothetical protein
MTFGGKTVTKRNMAATETDTDNTIQGNRTAKSGIWTSYVKEEDAP